MRGGEAGRMGIPLERLDAAEQAIAELFAAANSPGRYPGNKFNSKFEVSLAGPDSGRRGRPVGGNKVHTPKMRCRREEFDADALAFVGRFAEKNDA